MAMKNQESTSRPANASKEGWRQSRGPVPNNSHHQHHPHDRGHNDDNDDGADEMKIIMDGGDGDDAFNCGTDAEEKRRW